jgi:hypothetical protein
MRMDISSISRQIVKTTKSGLMNGIDVFTELLSIWTETKNDGYTLKIRKKGVN